jgi:adenosylmethionine-8-amino-7-oxononanoate aminotransferase
LTEVIILFSPSITNKEVGRSYTEGQPIPNEPTYSGAELGCVVDSAVFDITNTADVLKRARELAGRFAKGFADLPSS